MSGTQLAFTSDPFWTHLFTLSGCAMALACIYGATKKGLSVEGRQRHWAVAEQLFVFALLAFLFYALESLAHLRAPYYTYSTTFVDLVPRFSFPRFIEEWGDRAVKSSCTVLVQSLPGKIPISVVLLEASLTYSAMWTARKLGGTLWVQPFFAGFLMLTIDALLDPVVATGHTCDGALAPVTGNGVGLWHWFSLGEADLGSKPGLAEPVEHLLAQWFHIPVFNFAVWLSAPIAAVALINLLALGKHWLLPQTRNVYCRVRKLNPDAEPRHGKEGPWLLLTAGVLGFAVYGVVASSPGRDPSVSKQIIVLAGAATITLLLLVFKFGKVRTRSEVDGTLVLPAALALIHASIPGLTTGQLVARPWLMPVAIVALFVGLWLAWLPYRATLNRFIARLDQLDRFVRLHYFGFTAMLVLLGASFFPGDIRSSDVIALLVVAACFHVFSYVGNDLVDLELDRRDPRRHADPLVSGAISVPSASALVVSSVPFAFAATLYLFRFAPSEQLACSLVLASSFGLMFIYNRFGKRCPIPLLTDVTQGLAWGLLALFGALAVYHGEARLERATHVSWVLVAYGAGFIALINGIHGGLRDLPNDLKHGKRTLALWLGARECAGAAVSSTAVKLYAFTVQLGLAALVAVVLWVEGFAARADHERLGRYEDTARLVTACVLCGLALGASCYMLWRVVKTREPRRNLFVTWHLPVLLLPPIFLAWAASGPELVFKIAVTLCFFVPLLFRKDFLLPLARWVYDDGGLPGMLQRMTARRHPPSIPPADTPPADTPPPTAKAPAATTCVTPPLVAPSEEAGE